MTKEQIKAAIESVKAELDEIRDALIEIEDEDGDEDELTPQSHIDYLKEQEAYLVKEYYELWGKLDALKTA